MIRIRFDECVSWRTVDALRQLKLPDDIALECPHDYQGEGELDVPWIEAFAARDGRLVVSADANMRYVALERAALEASGLIAVFPSSKTWFDELRKYGQTAYLVRWFPVIERLAREADRGAHFRLPPSFTGDFDSITQLRSLAEIEAEKMAKEAAKAARRED